MNWIRTPTRLALDPATPRELATALRDWGAQGGTTEIVARLEGELATQLASPVKTRTSASKPGWLWGLSMATVIALIAFCFSERGHAPERHSAAAHHEQRASHASSAVNGGYLGAGPRDLANVGPVAVLYAMHR